MDEVKDRYDLVVTERFALRRHFEVVGFPPYLDGSVQAFEDDGYGALGISMHPFAACQGRECPSGRAFSIGCMAGCTIETVKLLAILCFDVGGC